MTQRLYAFCEYNNILDKDQEGLDGLEAVRMRSCALFKMCTTALTKGRVQLLYLWTWRRRMAVCGEKVCCISSLR